MILLKVALLGFAVVVYVDAWGDSKVLLRDVQVLTLTEGKQTTGRRNSPIPQLTCVGGSALKSNLRPSVAQCYSRGFDGHDVQWECKADLDNRVKFGTIEVACEGFDYPDDPYILQGSCGLEYKLEYTQQGGSGHGYFSANKHSGPSAADGLTFLIVAGVVVLIILYYTGWFDGRAGGAAATPGRGGGGGGGGSGYDDPPPPYPGNDRRHDHYGGGGRPSYGFKESYTSSNSSGSGPGFWSGMGAGGLLGYLAGNSRSNRGYNYGGGYNRGYGSNWFGDSSGAGPSWAGSGGPSSSSGGGSGSRQASGLVLS